MANYRIDRISEEVRHAVDEIIRGMNDPRIGGTYSVTRAEVTRDLKYAKIYISILEDDRADGFMQSVKKAAGYIRHELGGRVDLRALPQLIFVRDQNIAYGIYINELLKKVGTSHETDQTDQ